MNISLCLYILSRGRLNVTFSTNVHISL